MNNNRSLSDDYVRKCCLDCNNDDLNLEEKELIYRIDLLTKSLELETRRMQFRIKMHVIDPEGLKPGSNAKKCYEALKEANNAKEAINSIKQSLENLKAQIRQLQAELFDNYIGLGLDLLKEAVGLMTPPIIKLPGSIGKIHEWVGNIGAVRDILQQLSGITKNKGKVLSLANDAKSLRDRLSEQASKLSEANQKMSRYCDGLQTLEI